ncbi:MAG: SDR family NAD(P)-dependent oxidoreductase [Desulfatirhabdiaceae bacterium]
MNDIFSLKNKRLLVTGGTRGIGRAISLRFAQAGAHVIANYVRDDQAAEDLRGMALQQQLAIDVCRADLTSTKGLERLKELIDAQGQMLSGCVHCAATGVHRTFDELTTRQFDWVFALNIRAYFELMKILIPRLAKGAAIVALSSQGAVRAIRSYSLVGASKGALESFSRHLASELALKDIRVNILSPGSVATGAWDKMPDGEKRMADTIHKTPTSRLVTPDEVALAAQFLCSEASSGIIGHTLVVDGGASIVE